MNQVSSRTSSSSSAMMSMERKKKRKNRKRQQCNNSNEGLVGRLGEGLDRFIRGRRRLKHNPKQCNRDDDDDDDDDDEISSLPSVASLPEDYDTFELVDLTPVVDELSQNNKSHDHHHRRRRKSFSSVSTCSSTAGESSSTTTASTGGGTSCPIIPIRPRKRHYDIVIVACGCFWNPQVRFKKMRGVKRVIAGYTGGIEPDPTSRNIQDHTLALFVEFNTQKVTLQEILDMWHDNDDPWRNNGSDYSDDDDDYSYYEEHEGSEDDEVVDDDEFLGLSSSSLNVDVGNEEDEQEERSAIFTTSVEQHYQCLDFVRDLSATRPYDDLLVEVDRATTFYQAEEYHQDYITKQIQAAQDHVEAYRRGEIKSGLFTILE